MSGSAGASPSRKVQPPPPPGDASEQTVDYARGPVAQKSSIDALLPPGAESEPAPPPVRETEHGAFRSPAASFRHPTSVERQAPSIIADCQQPQAPKLSPEEKAQRRFWKNVIVFGVCLV